MYRFYASENGTSSNSLLFFNDALKDKQFNIILHVKI